MKGRVLGLQGRFKEAVQALATARRIRARNGWAPHFRYSIDEAVFLLELHRYREALRTLRSLAGERFSPPDASIWHELLGDALLGVRDLPGASVEYNRAIVIRNEAGLGIPFQTAEKLGWIRLRLRQFGEAAEWFQRKLDAGKRGEEYRVPLLRALAALAEHHLEVATLELIVAFETATNPFEMDACVVEREIVRRAFGERHDLRRLVLDNNRMRETLRQGLRGGFGAPSFGGRFGGLAGGMGFGGPGFMGGGPLPPLDADSFGGPPKELAMAVKELRAAKSGSPKMDRIGLLLFEAILSAWRGQRSFVLRSFQAAVRAGLADHDGMLAQYLTLQIRALKLGVQLDIQGLLMDISSAVLKDEEARAAELARLLQDFSTYLDVPLGPMATRMVEARLK